MAIVDQKTELWELQLGGAFEEAWCNSVEDSRAAR